MKYTFLTLTAAAALFGFAGCASDDEHAVQTSTTTTEETVVHQPAAATSTETRTYRSY